MNFQYKNTYLIRKKTQKWLSGFNFCGFVASYRKKALRAMVQFFVTEVAKKQYYAEDDNYRHDDAYGNQFERAASG